MKEYQISVLQSKLADRQKQIECMEDTLVQFQKGFRMFVESNDTFRYYDSEAASPVAPGGLLLSIPQVPVSPLTPPKASRRLSGSHSEPSNHPHQNNPFTYKEGGIENLAVRMRSLNNRLIAVKETINANADAPHELSTTASQESNSNKTAKKKIATHSYITPPMPKSSKKVRAVNQGVGEASPDRLFVIEGRGSRRASSSPTGRNRNSDEWNTHENVNPNDWNNNNSIPRLRHRFSNGSPIGEEDGVYYESRENGDGRGFFVCASPADDEANEWGDMN